MQYLQFLLAIVIGIVLISALIFVHELGHFIAAKSCKIRVTRSGGMAHQWTILRKMSLTRSGMCVRAKK